MKSKILLCLLLACSLCLPACVTTPQGTKTLDIPRTTNAINAVVPVAVRLAIQKQPASRQYLADAAAAISLFTSTSATFDPDALNREIQTAVGQDVLSPDALTAIDAAVALYKAYYGDALLARLNTPDWLLPVLQSLSSSITKGLNE